MRAYRMRFRFHEDDQERYGSDWYVYDEAALARLRFRELREIEAILEAEVGLSIESMMVRLRNGHADAKLAASWLARRQAGVVEDLAGYDPLLTLMTWEPGGDVDPPAEEAKPSPSSIRTRRSARS